MIPGLSPKKVSVVIAHRGDPLGLWATLCSCEEQFAENGFEHEYAIISNGQREQPHVKEYSHRLEKAKRLRLYHHRDAPMSPPSARQMGANAATGDIICFLDNHCFLGPHFFARAVLDLDKYGYDMLHGAVQYVPYGPYAYHYKLRLDKNFWGYDVLIPQHNYYPYQIAMAGHGAFFVTSDAWKATGGYWDGFVGYAGEESYLDLKFGLMGRKVVLDPKIAHHHYASARDYPRHFSDDYWRNLLMAANIIGGEVWMERVAANALHATRAKSSKTIFDLTVEAYERSRDHAEWMAANRLMPLEELLNQYRQHLVAF